MECGWAFVFRTGKNYDSTVSPLDRRVDGADFTALRRSLTPSTVVFGATCSSGILGTFIDGSSWVIQNPQTNCLSAFLIPKSLPDGVVIKHFAVPLADTNHLGTAVQDTITFTQTFGWSESETVKCMILVSANRSTAVTQLTRFLRAVYDGKFAVSGCVADEVRSTDNDEQQNSAIVGLLFAGENVCAASLVISEWQSGVRERLMELKATVATWGNCRQKLSFMFTAPHVSIELHNVTDFLMGTFKELMPDVLVNGMFFTSAQFGWDFLTTSPVAQAYKPHDYTATIAVVGFV